MNCVYISRSGWNTTIDQNQGHHDRVDELLDLKVCSSREIIVCVGC